MILLELFITFFEIGLFTFGGGYAMISIVREQVLAHSWMNETELLNMLAVAESTPGPVAINMATYVGSTQGGILGSLVATLGVVMPSFIIIVLISAVIKNFLKYEPVKAALGGIRPCVVALILGTAITLMLSTLFNFKTVAESTLSPDYIGIVIFGTVALSSFLIKKKTGKKPSAIIMIVLSAVMGMLLYSIF